MHLPTTPVPGRVDGTLSGEPSSVKGQFAEGEPETRPGRAPGSIPLRAVRPHTPDLGLRMRPAEDRSIEDDTTVARLRANR
jgi:hypothetical protein